MLLEAIMHQPTREYRYPTVRNRLVLRLRAKRKELKTCRLFYWNRYFKETTGEMSSEMKCFARDDRFDYFETEIEADAETVCYTKYYFELSDGRETVWLGAYGFNTRKPRTDFFEYLYTNEHDITVVPAWLSDTIFYQIFPERFYNGNPANDPEATVAWSSKPTRENFLGGDLAGITMKLGYLKELGINAIYLNPLFLSHSNHKYDTIDYFRIDPHLGTQEEARELIDECHRLGVKVILDGVFNHCGLQFPYFQDVIKNGWDSKYKDWFFVKKPSGNSEINEYECVGFYKPMPKLRLSNPETRQYFLEVALYWMDTLAIDGWRLDVADEIDFDFWQDFRKKVKQKKPDFLIMAETWQEARDMLRGDEMDTVMNYVFRDSLIGYFADRTIGSREFDSRINHLLALYPRMFLYALYNLIDSHDTERFLTRCGRKEAFKLAVAFQMTFVGVPAVYYGDEVGMTGGNDPDCRAGMIWDEEIQDRDILEWYKLLIRIRKSHQALSKGSYCCNLCDDHHNVYGFVRKTLGEEVYIVLNNSAHEAEIRLPVEADYRNGDSFRDEISGGTFRVSKIIHPGSFYNADLLEYRGLIQMNVQAYTACILTKNKGGI